MPLKTITPETLYAGLGEVQPLDHLVLLRFTYLDTASVHKLLRFPDTEALLDFLSHDLPILLTMDFNDREELYEDSYETVLEPDPMLRPQLQEWFAEKETPELIALLTKTTLDMAEQQGMKRWHKYIEVTLEWFGQPRELVTAPVPLLEEMREGLNRSAGQSPSLGDLLQLLVANDRVSAFFKQTLVGWYVMPGESRMDLSQEELESWRETLQFWWDDVESHPQPFLAEMWRPRYESIRSGMKP